MAWNVLILGGGFGGLYAARKLERELPPAAAKITIVSDEVHVTTAEGMEKTIGYDHEKLGLPLDRAGRIVVDRFCQVEGRTNAWAVGDAAAVPDPARRGQPTPPTCQHALRQGRSVAVNVAAALGAGRPKPFNYKTLGVFVDLLFGRDTSELGQLGHPPELEMPVAGEAAETVAR